MADVEFLVIGAGAAGLGAARELAARGRDVLLVDPEARVGGVMQSERVRGYLVEAGPNTFRLSASLVEFVERIGVSGILRPAAPASRERFLLRGGQLRPVPMGPGAFLATPLLSARGKLRLLAEPFLRRGDATGESVAAFLARRLGAEVVDALVGPFLTGVYAGDEAQLGAEAVFPSLTELERRYGSLALGGIRSAWAGRGGRTARGRPGTWSAADGAAGLAAALASGLSTPPRLETRAVSLRREGDAWRVVLRGPGGEEEVRAAGVVVATPAPEAAELLGNVDADAAALLAKIEYAPIVTVALGADPARTLRPIRGFGFL
ncbi:MAG: protoporphyrinogen oxidase, partial [Proteobacteria bacterium]|nr:protoporphyrinogen oxidase [Pseudomonadota bacterium]